MVDRLIAQTRPAAEGLNIELIPTWAVRFDVDRAREFRQRHGSRYG